MNPRACRLRKQDLVLLALGVALLICALVAVGGSGRQRAKEAVCQANLQRLGDAMTQFLADHDDGYPSPWTWLIRTEAPVAGYQRYCRWHDARYPPDGPVWLYLAKEKIALCPSFAGVAKELGKWHPLHQSSIPVDPQFSYSMNLFLGSPNRAAYDGGLKSADITRSKAEVFVFAEENVWLRPGNANVFNDTALCGDGREWFGTFHDAPPDNPNGGVVNAVFVDGHVQKVRSGLVVTEGLQADRSGAEYGVFEKYAWPFAKAP
jgi:prepilin-type processing-associated H-X9-DG protein